MRYYMSNILEYNCASAKAAISATAPNHAARILQKHEYAPKRVTIAIPPNDQH